MIYVYQFKHLGIYKAVKEGNGTEVFAPSLEVLAQKINKIFKPRKKVFFDPESGVLKQK